MSFEKTLWTSADGEKERVSGAEHVVVVGGGIAGLAAATILAERGVRVTLFEKEGFLGGRAGSWDDHLGDGTPFQMERGFHAFFRHYYNLRGLIARIDPANALLVPMTDYPLHGPDGAVESFSGLPKRPPWNLVKLVWRSPSLKLKDLFRVDGPAASAMLAYDPKDTYERWDSTTAGDYLDSLRFPESARRMLFDVFAHSFFNPEERFSAAELLMYFHYYFLGNPEGLIFDCANVPFSRGIWDPLAARLRALGVRIETSCAVSKVSKRGETWSVATDRGDVDADALVLAVTVPGLKAIVEASPELGEPAWRRDVEGLGVTSAFAVLRLWLDKPVNDGRAPFVGTTGLGTVDNISLFHLLEDESREWAEKTGGSVVELHAYALPDVYDQAEVRADLIAQLHALYPETRDAKIVEERWLVRQDCAAFPPGAHARRPTVETPDPTVTLAGDFVRMPFPTALMERAASSGMMAANHLLARWGVRGEPLYTIPERGMLASVGTKIAPPRAAEAETPKIAARAEGA